MQVNSCNRMQTEVEKQSCSLFTLAMQTLDARQYPPVVPHQATPAWSPKDHQQLWGLQECIWKSVLQFFNFITPAQTHEAKITVLLLFQSFAAALSSPAVQTLASASSCWFWVYYILRKSKRLKKCSRFCCIQVNIKFLHPFPPWYTWTISINSFILLIICSMEVQCHF